MPQVVVIAARIIPIVLLGIIGYVSWVVTSTVVVNHFFKQGIFGDGDVGSGIAILAIYWILFTLVVSTFLRLLWTTAHDPGYLERGDAFRLPEHRAGEKLSSEDGKNPSRRDAYPAPRLADILSKDVFMCEPDGMPRWCSTCLIWRPDRSRHCREKDRCVLKHDHFCPWVGGMVTETSMPFFIQFNCYTVVYAFFDWVLAAACIARGRSTGMVDGNWVAMLILGIFFMLLTAGIGLSSVMNAITNHTTPENVAEPSGHQWNLALRVPDGITPAQSVRTVVYPDLPDGDADTLRKLLNDQARSFSSSPASETDSTASGGHPHVPRRGPTFAIIQTAPFSNPWDLGKYNNWCQIMGRHPWNWFLPFRSGAPWFSSLTYGHGRDVHCEELPKSFFPTGPDVRMARASAGLEKVSDEETRQFQEKLTARRAFPYILGGAGAPMKQWAASFKNE